MEDISELFHTTIALDASDRPRLCVCRLHWDWAVGSQRARTTPIDLSFAESDPTWKVLRELHAAVRESPP
jgi:hypothetical protein